MFGIAKSALMLLALSGALHAPASTAQSYPVKPIRMFIPLPPGGAVDVVARTAGNFVAEKLGQSFVYESRAGGNTIISTEACAKATPDGYTVCFITSSVSLNPYLYAKMPYDHLRDLAPITQLLFTQDVLIMNASVPVNTLQELVAYSKANPKKINYGSVGTGSLTHLAPEWLRKQTGTDWTHIPYKGTTEVLTALLTGDVHLVFFALGNPGLVGFINSGKFKGLMVTPAQRIPLVPNVPTTAETAIPDHGFRSWWGMAAPAKVPGEIIGALNSAFVEAVRNAGVREKFAALGLELIGSSPAEFARFLADDRERAERIVKSSGARLE